MSVQGSCLCGQITYEVTGPLYPAMLCHCQICRKSNGSAYALNIPIDRDSLVFNGSTHTLARFSSTPNVNRYFCNACGSPIYSERTTAPDQIRLRAGTLDTDIQLEKACHIFVDSKAQWDDIEDDLPQYSERP